MTPVAGGGETEKEVSAWTVDSTREWIDDVHAWRDRVDMWRDRLYDERERHSREVDALTAKMLEQRFQASQEANTQLAAANAEKFAGFPQQYALRGETTAKLETIERAIADLVAVGQARVGSETALVTQRTERRLSTGALIGIAVFVLAALQLLVPWITRG